MGYTDGSCCGDKVRHGALPMRAAEGEVKERRGGPLDKAGVWAVVSPKEERKEREGGVYYEGRGMRVESQLGSRKRRNTQCTKTASTARCRGHAKMGC